ncbi:MAG: HlyD family type I secretion periplasmic adaptor subunit [Synergistaceae bacterium]|jgi:hemolysin D|nr:HlyD family type I secretion periplasmic adaptor subunit [Synergistaceae bacterium]
MTTATKTKGKNGAKGYKTRGDWNISELEFLPAALEIVESPPSPIGRALLWIIVTFFVITLSWSIIGRVDEVAVAPGKVIPSGYTKVVQAEDKGIVRKLNVTNGTPVRAGDVLMELDTVVTEADMMRLRQERDFYLLDLARLYSERDNKAFVPPEGIGKPDEALFQQELSRTRLLEFRSRMDALKQQVLIARSALNNSVKQLEKYSSILPIVTEQRKRTEELVEDGTVSLFEHQNYVQKEIEVRQDKLAQEDEVQRNRHTVLESEMGVTRAESEWHSEISSRIVDDHKQLQAVEEELKKAEEKNRLSRITAPIDGVVQQLEIHTLGAILTPAQPLMLIVPEGGSIEYEVWIENRDIGFIYADQEVEIKVETFGFQRYGTLEGRVKSVAKEAKEDDKKGLIYQAFIETSRDHYMIDGKKVQLLPGMAVTGEIKIREKRIIEYFLDTFRQYVDEALRER